MVVPVAVLVVLAAAVPARAGEVSLWSCRGPDGAALGAAPFTTIANGDAVIEAGCAGASGGMRARFTRADPAGQSDASVRLDVPPGTALVSTAAGPRLARARL